MASLLLKFWGRLLPGKGFGLAAAGSWQRGQVKVELRQATGGLGHAGLGRQQGKKKSIGKVKKKSKKSQKKVKCAAPGLGGLLETTKSQKKVKKKSKKVNSDRDSGAGQGWALGTLGWLPRPPGTGLAWG